jgi:hypothetical protein
MVMVTVRERSKAQVHKVKGAALNSYADAKEAVEAVYSNTQDTLQSGLDKTQHTIIDGWEKMQSWLHHLNPPVNRIELPTKSRRSILPLVSHNTLSVLSDQQQKGLKKAQKRLDKQAVQAGERLTKVQQKLGDSLNEAQNTLQNSIQIAKAKMMATLGTALDRGTRPANKVSRTLRQAGENVKELKETAQERHEQRVRKRRRARLMFRWGLIIGVVLALLYTPKPGVEIRTKLTELWHTYRTRLGL